MQEKRKVIIVPETHEEAYKYTEMVYTPVEENADSNHLEVPTEDDRNGRTGLPTRNGCL